MNDNTTTQVSSTTAALHAKRESLVRQLAKVDLAIAQAGFVDSLVQGAYVYGTLNDGTVYTHARVLGISKADGTSGNWFKLRLHEDTVAETVKSVRLSNIDGVEGAAPEGTTTTEPEAEVPVEATPLAPKSKKASTEEI